ncbi:hypothetical protein FRAAL0991 [Frankia alni ACN14a]|uniref:Uncharacterized protein n=1 Tax=Frankia alni (strain DSM 45986 / CECT 9034 / ACN14a) TaxID=326424 RepID=Q0RS09_FRAAA|nr:hypothetical protein FRAAL0991 [Frankia alni ACN14a]
MVCQDARKRPDGMDISIIRGLAASAVTRAVDTGKSYPPAPTAAAAHDPARLRLAGHTGMDTDLGVGESPRRPPPPAGRRPRCGGTPAARQRHACGVIGEQRTADREWCAVGIRSSAR